MTLEEIKANKPEGATHYGGKKKIGYFKRSSGKWSMYMGEGRWWSDYKEVHDIYWFFGWYYCHKFISPDVSHKLKPL